MINALARGHSAVAPVICHILQGQLFSIYRSSGLVVKVQMVTFGLITKPLPGGKGKYVLKIQL